MQFDIRRFDIYRKVPKDLTQPTYTGAFISILCCVAIVVGLDIQDESGRHEVGFEGGNLKTPINNGEGCNFAVNFTIRKVPGNFHVSTHSSHEQPLNPDMAHVIHDLFFGDIDRDFAISIRRYLVSISEGSFNPLENRDHSKSDSFASHEYYLKIVPSTFTFFYETFYPYQYTFAHKEFLPYGMGGNPAIWFRYDFSPIAVRYAWAYKPFYHFLTMVCAIVGGVFTVAGILDSMIFTAAEIFRKAELGKLS